ncbi:WXG100 family type VII secretion target [Lentzea sp. NBRC 102530]|uniref:WXG100 family type VII secretion target n=1 Tax=Lentzea sp. NBRC 102530 TaxID=3032201 RepID=UPI0024A2F92E|nr:WXG100 family type VII secretion target [Lentzea sp. NBRC 102530]GLY46818.1 hypothetical protein Lesp01_04740 [Lentzea sp. NBRC 102530]
MTYVPDAALATLNFDQLAQLINEVSPDVFYTRATAFDSAVARLEAVRDGIRREARAISDAWQGRVANSFDDAAREVDGTVDRVLQSMTEPGYGTVLRHAGDALAEAQRRIRDLRAQGVTDSQAALRVLHDLGTAYQHCGDSMPGPPNPTELSPSGTTARGGAGTGQVGSSSQHADSFAGNGSAAGASPMPFAGAGPLAAGPMSSAGTGPMPFAAVGQAAHTPVGHAAHPASEVLGGQGVPGNAGSVGEGACAVPVAPVSGSIFAAAMSKEAGVSAVLGKRVAVPPPAVAAPRTGGVLGRGAPVLGRQVADRDKQGVVAKKPVEVEARPVTVSRDAPAPVAQVPVTASASASVSPSAVASVVASAAAPRSAGAGASFATESPVVSIPVERTLPTTAPVQAPTVESAPPPFLPGHAGQGAGAFGRGVTGQVGEATDRDPELPISADRDLWSPADTGAAVLGRRQEHREGS